MKASYSIEDIFSSGWQAYNNMLHDGNAPQEMETAWQNYRHQMLLEHEGAAVADFWLQERKKLMGQSKVYDEVKCPDCGGDMVSRSSQYGRFWGCKKYPQCKGTRDSMGRSKKEAAAERGEEQKDDSSTTSEASSGFTFRKS